MKMVELCKLHLPEDIMKFMEEYKDNNEILEEYGTSIVGNMVQTLFNKDDICVPCIHIFTLNNLSATKKVLEKFVNTTDV